MHVETNIRAWLVVLAAVLILLPAQLGAQMPDEHHVLKYGPIETTAKESYAAGLGYLTLEREGADRSQWVYKAEALDQAGEPIGRIEVQYPDEKTADMTFTRADSTAIYRISFDHSLFPWSYVFENVGVEGFTITRNCDPRQLKKPEATKLPSEEYEAWSQAMAECIDDVTTTGAFQTRQEAYEAYGEVTDFMAAVKLEIKSFLQGYKRKLEGSQQRSPDGGPAESDGRRSGGGLGTNMKSFAIGVCPPGMRLDCDVDILNGGNRVPGEGFGFSKSGCCMDASEDADINCQLYGPRLPCCANSLCAVTSGGGGCSLFCYCALIGFHFECEPYCT